MVTSFDESRTSARDRATLRIAVELGAIAVPACARELASGSPARRAWARVLLGAIARAPRDEERVRRSVRELLGGDAPDDAKIDALALLADLGEVTMPACFSDPAAIQRRSVEELAGHLGSVEDVASAAALVAEGLEPPAIAELVEGLSEIAPAAAERLVDELAARVDVDPMLRGELRRIISPLKIAPPPFALSEDPEGPSRRATLRPALVEVHRHAGGSAVVAIARRVPGQRRWRAFSVLVDETGTLADAWYDGDCPPRKVSGEILAPLAGQGFLGGATSPQVARRLVADAARSAVALGRGLPPSYYLGRDLLELGDAHLAGRPAPDEIVTALGRAVDLLASGDPARARPLLEHCAERAPDDPLVASSLGLCLSAQGDPRAALPWLDRAARLEPAWPIHHWNLAAAAHQARELDACYLAMTAFVARSAAATVHDPDHVERLALAKRLIAEHERLCRLEGRALPRSRARARARAGARNRSRGSRVDRSP
ncbi:MAG TPA: tetratricopeptide repeat protein [Kofleriaceae bacterium]|nr:tetratricopeptide repeat protein [Kofleriaceae bacterium]